MKYGYLEFRYNNRRSFTANDAESSDVTINIGDNIQSLAIRSLFKRLSIPDSDIIGINRDDLPNYDGEPVMLMMNGCFYPHCFPLPPNITPMFFGFNTDSVPLVRKHRAMFLQHQPIGCRDEATLRILRKEGIQGYVSGCLTLTFEKRHAVPEVGRVVIAYGRGAGEFPGALLPYIPPALLKDAVFIYQREPVKVMPLGKEEIEEADMIARGYVDFYASKAALIITPLLHVASPCTGMGIPVVLARKADNPRFTAINRLMPLYTPENFRHINWSPGLLDVQAIQQAMTRIAARLVNGQQADSADIEFLKKIYAVKPLEDGLPKTRRPKSKRGIRRWFRWLVK
jgi:hypothetical protein